MLDKILNTAFSFGAAIVIFGAWAKIETLEFGNIALTAGLLTETLIFCCYGLLEWRRKPGRTDDVPTSPAHNGTPVYKENVEALTDSIRQTARLLNKIFRV
ncbi:MAG TPA: hypothetical protein VHE34_13750 [Puia sp.]|uniref:GldL-related protein n=1 Tax=Puia sp. TaxID=2045100 RepID=UPI002B746566|nr:hypothetical protein [Puia sp.]HVU96288.1 hypothetical protein [Puia sp.]